MIMTAKQLPITLTDAAAEKVWSLMVDEENTDLFFRSYITGGGCSGFQYGFTFEEQAQGDDTTILKAVVGQPNNQVKLIVDPISFPYLTGAEIDYVTDINGERFVIRNPNAKGTCGCGSSFSA